MVRPQINSVKHIVQVSLANVVGGAVTNISLALASDVGDIDSVTEVRIGSSIKAVYIELWLTSDDATQSSTVAILEKQPIAGDNITAAEIASLNSYSNKNNIFYITQGLLGQAINTATPLMRGWFKIPKGKQRMSISSKIQLSVLAQSDGVNLCGFALYKEYF